MGSFAAILDKLNGHSFLERLRVSPETIRKYATFPPPPPPPPPKTVSTPKLIRPRKFQTTYKFVTPIKHTKEYKLTREEKTILPLLPCPNSHISILLGIGIKAVEKTIANLLCKFEVASRQEVIVLAVKNQIIDIEDYVLPPKSYNRRP